MAEIFTEQQVTKIINEYLSKLKGKINIDKAVLYGSYAKGCPREYSDIDLFIISGDLPEDKLKGSNGYYLNKLVGDFSLDLEVIAVNPGQLNNPIEKSFFDEIMTTGKVIYSNGKEETSSPLHNPS